MERSAVELHRSNADCQIYGLVTQATNLAKGRKSVSERSSELKAIWREIDHYRPVENPYAEERAYILKDL